MPAFIDAPDFEAEFDSALPAILAPFTLAPAGRFKLFGNDSADTTVVPRLEYSFELGAPVGPQGSVPQLSAGPGDRVAMCYGFTIGFVFGYDVTKTNLKTLGTRGQLRALLAPAAQAFSVATLPNLQITKLNEISAARGRLATDGSPQLFHAWSTRWAGEFMIRS